MSSNIPPNSPPIPGGNGLNPQAMWMPYSFVQFDGSFNNNPSNNRISQPQGMSAYGGVIFQQPFQPPQLQNDPNRPNSEMMPQFPLISSPPPPANITNTGNAVMSPNQVSAPLINPISENVMLLDQNSVPSRNTIHPPENLQLRDSQILSRNSMICSPPLPRHQSPPPNDASGQQFQPVFQPMLVGWQPVQHPGLINNPQQPNQPAQQGVPDVIGYQSQISNIPPVNISPYEFQHFPPDVIPGPQAGPQDQHSYINNEGSGNLEQPTYANDGAVRAHSVQPAPAHEEPSYINETSEDAKRNSRGLSLPPVILKM